MTNEQIKQLHKQAYRSAFRLLGNKQDAEEVASDVMERITVNDLTDYRIKFLVIDAIRKKFGRINNANHSVRMAIYRAEGADGDYSLEDPKNYLESFCRGIDIEKTLDRLNPIERCVVMLIIKYGFTNREVADCFGHSPEWCSLFCAQLVEEIKEKMQ
jgi:DNA-directed RNA polymerase specialized sigma24 family protein